MTQGDQQEGDTEADRRFYRRQTGAPPRCSRHRRGSPCRNERNGRSNIGDRRTLARCTALIASPDVNAAISEASIRGARLAPRQQSKQIADAGGYRQAVNGFSRTVSLICLEFVGAALADPRLPPRPAPSIAPRLRMPHAARRRRNARRFPATARSAWRCRPSTVRCRRRDLREYAPPHSLCRILSRSWPWLNSLRLPVSNARYAPRFREAEPRGMKVRFRSQSSRKIRCPTARRRKRRSFGFPTKAPIIRLPPKSNFELLMAHGAQASIILIGLVACIFALHAGEYILRRSRSASSSA